MMEKESLICDTCSVRFKSKLGLIGHICKDGKIGDDVIIDFNSQNKNPWKVESVQAFSCLKCPECSFNTKQEALFQDHAVENHPLSIVLFGKIKSLYISSLLFGEDCSEELRNRSKTEVENRKLILKSGSTIPIHERFTSLRNRKPIHAKESENIFNPNPRTSLPQKHHVSKDNERSHTGINLYSCKVCDKKFTQLNSLEVHGRIHTNEKPYSCTYCDKKFIQAQSLKDHERIHTGEKPYSCTTCDKKFKKAYSLMVH